MARKIPLRYRVQEYLADRFSFVQYPNVRARDKSGKLSFPYRFAHQMPWYLRIALAAVGLFTSVFFLAIALLGAYMLKAFIVGMAGG
ncbi:hypothetical protein [Herbaspirillum frisingense]|uniref:hypothetical protein n=1 Tax=Herbaspirillum frisingense TaxID=92645 RepID=UPI0039B034CD